MAARTPAELRAQVDAYRARSTRTSASALALTLVRALRDGLELDQSLDRPLGLELSLDLARTRASEISPDDWSIDIDRSLDVNPTLARTIARTIAIALSGALARTFDPGSLLHGLSGRLVDDLGKGGSTASLAGAHGLAESLATSDHHDLDELNDWVASINYGYTALWAVPATAGAATLSPEADERISFERVWGLVEQAADSGRLSAEDDAEARVLSEMRQLAMRLDPARHGDLYDDLSRRIMGIVPAVLEALVSGPPPRSVLLAARAAPADQVIEALTEDLETNLFILEEAAAGITETPDQPARQRPEVPAVPILNEQMRRLHGLFRRVDATHALLVSTKTGRSLLRGIKAGVAAVAAAAASPVPGIITASSAAAITAVTDWVYTVIRRQERDLPPRNHVDNAG